MRPRAADVADRFNDSTQHQYQHRADLVSNLVSVVKGFAAQEKDVLLGVTNDRSRVDGIQATPELINDLVVL